jgi:hypothetical protein
MNEGSGSLPLTKGSRPRRPKYIWIRNTGSNIMFTNLDFPLRKRKSLKSLNLLLFVTSVLPTSLVSKKSHKSWYSPNIYIFSIASFLNFALGSKLLFDTENCCLRRYPFGPAWTKIRLDFMLVILLDYFLKLFYNLSRIFGFGSSGELGLSLVSLYACLVSLLDSFCLSLYCKVN